jgi:hypothetical protein
MKLPLYDQGYNTEKTKGYNTEKTKGYNTEKTKRLLLYVETGRIAYSSSFGYILQEWDDIALGWGQVTEQLVVCSGQGPDPV